MMNLHMYPCLPAPVKPVGCNASAHQEIQTYRGTNASQLEVVNYAQRFQECQATRLKLHANDPHGLWERTGSSAS